jgi:hypothetical protein
MRGAQGTVELRGRRPSLGPSGHGEGEGCETVCCFSGAFALMFGILGVAGATGRLRHRCPASPARAQWRR